MLNLDTHLGKIQSPYLASWGLAELSLGRQINEYLPFPLRWLWRLLQSPLCTQKEAVRFFLDSCLGGRLSSPAGDVGCSGQRALQGCHSPQG